MFPPLNRQIQKQKKKWSNRKPDFQKLEIFNFINLERVKLASTQVKTSNFNVGFSCLISLVAAEICNLPFFFPEKTLQSTPKLESRISNQRVKGSYRRKCRGRMQKKRWSADSPPNLQWKSSTTSLQGL